MPAPAVTPPVRFAFDPRGGRLYLAKDADLIIMLPWPMMKAFRWTGRGDTPTVCCPDFVVPPDRNDPPERAGRLDFEALPSAVDMDYEGLAELQTFCEAIPATIRRAVSAFRERQWQLLAWLSSGGPAAVQLLHATPALAFAVACGAELNVREAPIQFLQKLPLMAYHGQIDLLARLGFPATEGARRILRKVAPGAVTVARLKSLREWFRDEEIVRRLAHTPAVSDAVLALLESGTFAAVDDATLHRMAEAPDGDAADVARRLSEAVALWGLVRPTRPLPRFNGVERIQAVHAELREDVTRVRRAAGQFPAAPVPGTDHIVHIDSSAMLVEESRIQRNCVDTYAPAIKRGRLAVYRVLEPQRATLAIRRRRAQWEIAELKGTANSVALAETVFAVRLWLNRTTSPDVRDAFLTRRP